MKAAVIALFAVVSFSSALAAESLANKKYWSEQNEAINERHLAAANEKCGTKFKFDWIDKAEFKKKAEPANASPSGVCSEIVDEFFSLCGAGADEKKAVKAKITEIRCGWSDKRSLALAKGVLTFKGNNTESNFSDWAKPWLMNSL